MYNSKFLPKLKKKYNDKNYFINARNVCKRVTTFDLINNYFIQDNSVISYKIRPLHDRLGIIMENYCRVKVYLN